MKLLRYLWASPTTLPALAIFWPLSRAGGGARVVRGCVEIWGGPVQRLLAALPLHGGAVAMTLGHVIIGQTPDLLEAVREHEHIHVRQYERWGPFFIPAYLLASVWIILRGGRAYLDNPFEVEAYRPAAPEQDRSG